MCYFKGVDKKRRSGKTFSTLMWLYFLCSGKDKYNVMIAAASASQLQATIQDAEDCLGLTITGNKVYGDSCMLPNGSLWQFKNFDEYTKCVGQKADYLFLNEAVNLDEKSFGTLIQGIRKQIILNYNPTRSCWVSKYINDDKSNYLITKWSDNPYLTEYQIEEFENIKKRALSPTATIFDKYSYEVFYKGEFADMGGKVFPAIYTCSDQEFEQIPVPFYSGIDFGFIENRDQTAMVQIKVWQNNLYIKEMIYSSQLTNDKDLALRLAELGYTYQDVISCDYGSFGRNRINNLVTAGNYTWTESGINKGFNCINAVKTKVLDGIQSLLQLDKIIVTEDSVNLRRELDSYEIDSNGKPKGSDHLIDCVRYSYNYYLRAAGW